MTIVAKIKLLIEQRGLSNSDVARALGVNRSNISMYFSGKRELTDDKILDILTKALNFRLQDAKEELAKLRAEEYFSKAGLDLPEGAIPMADNYTYVPLLAEVSCGEGIDMEAVISSGEHEALVPVPNDYIKDDKKTYAFTAKGSSMSTEIQDGDTVVIHLTKEYSPGKVHLYRIGEDFGLARLQRETDGSVTIKKANPQYPPVQVGGREIEVCGVVQVVLNLRVY